jgi:Zn-dependent metalloprotease
MCLFLKAEVGMGDILLIYRNERGIVEFARFATNENPDRSMANDVVFLKSMLKTREGDDFRLKSEITDDIGITSRKYRQYFMGIRVDNAEYLVHGRNGNIEVINGDFRLINIESMVPVITELQAFGVALEYVGARKYKWECEAMENFIKQHKNDSDATYYPKGELVIAEDVMRENGLHKLSWQFTISSLEPYNAQIVFVDAIRGEIIRDIPLIWHSNTASIAQTMYSGTQTITCGSTSSGFRLYENRNTTSTNSVIVRTRNSRNSNNIGSRASEFTNTNTNWVAGSWATFAQSQHALDVHWAAEKVLDYWSTVHRRNSLDNSGLSIRSYVHYHDPHFGFPNNAIWDGNSRIMAYGDGDGILFNPLTSLDIVAHEMGHGIVQFVAGLTGGPFESAALNEGFSDIWAAAVKSWVNPTLPIQYRKDVWLLGREIFRIPFWSNSIRNMQNPKCSLTYGGPNPNTYRGNHWDFTNQNSHRNSTVLSHWFYLLSEGGNGINDLNNAFVVPGIGINKAERIAYRTLHNLNSSANFQTTRNASITAAEFLYGLASKEVVAVTDAWHAVGVGNRHAPIIFGSTNICGTAGNYYLTGNYQASRWFVTPSNAFDITWNATSATVTTQKFTGQTAILTAVVGGHHITFSLQACNTFIDGPPTVCSTAIYTLSQQALTMWSIEPTWAFAIESDFHSATVTATNLNGQSGILTARTGAGATFTKFIEACCSPTAINITNQTITTNTTITHCSQGDINAQNLIIQPEATLTLEGADILLQNVVAKPGSKLILDASGKIHFGTGFKVELGGELEIR